jgi:hypothetical protein
MKILTMLAIAATAATSACMSTDQRDAEVAPAIHPGPEVVDAIDRELNSGTIADGGGDIEAGGPSDGTIHPSPEVRDAIADALHGDTID